MNNASTWSSLGMLLPLMVAIFGVILAAVSLFVNNANKESKERQAKFEIEMRDNIERLHKQLIDILSAWSSQFNTLAESNNKIGIAMDGKFDSIMRMFIDEIKSIRDKLSAVEGYEKENSLLREVVLSHIKQDEQIASRYDLALQRVHGRIDEIQKGG